jgi:hypothetical protein
VSVREDSGRVYVDLRNVGAAVKDGVNVLAIECHLAAGESQDLRLDPELVAED